MANTKIKSRLFITSEALSYSVVIWAFVIQVLATISLFLGYPIAPWVILVSFLIASFLPLIICEHFYVFLTDSEAKIPLRTRFALIFVHLSIFCCIVELALLVGTFFFDISWDGNWHHGEAIGQLAHGTWNPFLNPSIAMSPRFGGGETWMIHYPKGNYLLGAAVYVVTGDIQSGKLFSLLLVLSSALSVYHLLSSILPRNSNLWALAIAVVVSLNPINLCQVFTYYQDSFIFSVIVLLMVFAIEYFRKPSWRYGVLIVMVLTLLINSKLSGLAYSFLLLFVVLFPLMLLFSTKHAVRRFPFQWWIGGVVFGVFFVGFNPYITNLKSHGNPIYPIAFLTTANQMPRVLGHQLPDGFYDLTQLEKLAKSLFSKVNNHICPDCKKEGKTCKACEVHWKIPFSLSKGELSQMVFPGVRISAFGPLFSGVLCLAFLYLLLIFAKDFDQSRKNSSPESHPFARPMYLKRSVLIIAASSLLSVVLVPESWLGRYVPHAWLFPALIIIPYLVLYQEKRSHLVMAMHSLILSVMLINSMLIAYVVILYNCDLSNRLHREFDELKEDKHKVYLDLNIFLPLRYLFLDRGIAFEERDYQCKFPLAVVARTEDSDDSFARNLREQREKYRRARIWTFQDGLTAEERYAMVEHQNNRLWRYVDFDSGYIYERRECQNLNMEEARSIFWLLPPSTMFIRKE